jgi:hypothetical protein
VSDRDAMEKAAREYGLAVNQHRKERQPHRGILEGQPQPWLDRPDAQTQFAFQAGWRACLDGPAVTALKAFFDKIDDIDLDYYEEKTHKANYLVMDIREALAEFEKLKGGGE